MDSQYIIAGLSPGGFKDLSEVRILICYLLDSVPDSMTKDQLQEIFQDNHLVDYFMFSNALADLIRSNHIYVREKQGEEYYKLSPLGKETADLLKKSIPLSVRERVAAAAIEMMATIRRERETEVKVTETQNGYNVTCIIHDTDFDLMSCQLFVPDMVQVEVVKKNFLENPTKFYSNIINFLTR